MQKTAMFCQKREIDLLAEHTVTELVGDDSLGHLQDLQDFINTIEMSDTNMDNFFENRFSTHKIKRHNRWLELSEEVFDNYDTLSKELNDVNNTLVKNNDDVSTKEYHVSNDIFEFDKLEGGDLGTISKDLYDQTQRQIQEERDISEEYHHILENLQTSMENLELNHLDTYNGEFEAEKTRLEGLIDTEDTRIGNLLGTDGTFQALLDEDERILGESDTYFSEVFSTRRYDYETRYELISKKAFDVNKFADNGDVQMREALTSYSNKFNELYNEYEGDRVILSSDLSDDMFYQEKLRNQLSDHYSQNLANLSTDIDNLDTNYILKEGELSKNIYDVKQELINYENMKAHADNPVFTGTLVLGNSSSSNANQKGALKVGDNWTIRSVKNSANTHINLEFVYKEGLSGETVIKFASQASYGTSHMDENPYDRMRVEEWFGYYWFLSLCVSF